MTGAIQIDARKLGIVVKVQLKNVFLAKLGFGIMVIGARLAGAELVDEFPMSLIEPKDLQIVRTHEAKQRTSAG